MIQSLIILWILYRLSAPFVVTGAAWLVFIAKAFCWLADMLD
jgi:hypothetical protein